MWLKLSRLYRPTLTTVHRSLLLLLLCRCSNSGVVLRVYIHIMTQNPLFNAAGAFVYIVLVVLGIAHFVEPGPDTILIPMAMLALFVLSACVMGYIFLYQPTLLFIAGEHT